MQLSHRYHHPLFHLLHRGQCTTLHQVKSIHARITVQGFASLHPSLALTKILYALTLLLIPPSLPPADSCTAYALALFRSIPSPSTFPHNLLIRAHTLLSSPVPALLLFAHMRRSSVAPDSHTFPFALKACARLRSPNLGRSLHSQALKFGFAADLYVRNSLISTYNSCLSLLEAQGLFDECPSARDVVTYNTLIDGYVKAGDFAFARKLFDDMPERDVVSWGTLLAGYSQMGQFEEAISFFDQMLATGTRPDEVALVSVLSCCAQLGKLDRGEAIHEYIKKNRAKLNVYLSTGLVDMYAKCGCISVAVEIFESTPRKNLFTWNAIIVGLAVHGNGQLSLEYFDRMRAVGVEPDGVTFLGVLVACSHAGLIEMARSLFDEMESIYGVERELKHYGCMADLLGRAGLVEETMEMIKGMPMKGDAYVWGGVLAGCRIQGNVEIAEIAAQHLLQLNPEDSGIYSIMSDVYATAKRWEDVARIRKLMGDKRVKKNVGCSSVEVGDGSLHGRLNYAPFR
ncbi:pentatricopeptide repeat-containing protein At5g61800-like [Musa acuminata AAA Group]|uniref:pentatricopeptide repeat-containing protein At5g61800-like n=1 Tax=Musa acuminata AAA Group TaxID=214697 RepID=UPI0031D365E6